MEELKVRITAETGQFKAACEEANAAVKNVGKDTSSISKLETAFKNLGKTIIAAFSVKAIIDFGKQCVEAAASVEAANSAFASTLGENAEAMTAQLQQLGEETGITYTRMTEAATLYYNKWIQNGYDAQTAMDMTTQSLALGADAAAYYNMSLDTANDHIKSFINGNLNAGDAIGISTNATQLASWAAQQLGVDYNKASEAQKQAIRQEYIQYMYSVSGVMGQASKESGAYENVMGNLKEAWRQFQAIIGLPILQNVVIPGMQAATAALGSLGAALKSAQAFINEHKAALTALGVAIAAVAAGVAAYKVVQMAQIAMNAAEVSSIGALIAAKAASAAATLAAMAPYILIAAAIAALIAVIVLCVQHWDEIKAKVQEVAQNIKAFVEDMVNKVKEKFEAMKAAVESKVEGIKSAVSAKFSAMKETMGSIMSAAKELVSSRLDAMKAAYEANGGGIKGIVAATMTGIKNYYQDMFAAVNALTGGKLGELVGKFQSGLANAKAAVSGALEAIKAKFQSIMDAAKNLVQTGIDAIKNIFSKPLSLPSVKLPHFSISGSFSLNPPSVPRISVSWYAQGGVFDMPTLFGYGRGMLGGLGENGAEAVVPLEKNTQWLDKIAERLGEKIGNRPIVMEVDGKVFGQVACDSINGLTRQTGKLNLVIG